MFGLVLSFGLFLPLNIFLAYILPGEIQQLPMIIVISKVTTELLFSLIPLTVGIAILRAGLFDIDLIIRRSLVYSLQSAILALLYLGCVILLQQLFQTMIGSTSDAAIVLSTLAIAALFTPLHRTIQNLIDRRFYRRKYDTAKTLASFNTRLRDEVDLELLRSDIENVVDETLQPTHVSLWLREARKE